MTTLPDCSGADDRPREVQFSVIINAYNGEAFLKETIDSVLAQTFDDWELIIWDDKSTDRTGEVCAAYSDRRIRYFVAETNSGLGPARNLAVQHAVGEWLAFLDQDDVWLPHKLAAQHKLIADDTTGRLALVYGRTMRFGVGVPRPFDPWFGSRPLPEGDIFTALLSKATFIALSSAAFRRDVFNELGGIPANISCCSDYYLCVSIARNYHAACVQELCCYYRVHPGSMSNHFRRQIHEEALRIIDRVAGPEHRRLVRTRQKIHHTWIGLEEIRVGDRRRGATRILRDGSLAYLALRPFVVMTRTLLARLARPRPAGRPLPVAKAMP